MTLEEGARRVAGEAAVEPDQEEGGVGGEVTLTGTVGSREERRRAEDVAEGASGVTYVLNNLRVRQPGGSGATG